MTAKAFLEQYREADRKAKRLKAEYDKERMLIDALRSSSDLDGMPHGSSIRRNVEDKAVRLADKALEWKEAELEAIRIRQAVFETVRNVPGIEGDVLYERYVNLRPWKEISCMLHYSEMGVYHIHKRALDMVVVIEC